MLVEQAHQDHVGLGCQRKKEDEENERVVATHVSEKLLIPAGLEADAPGRTVTIGWARLTESKGCCGLYGFPSSFEKEKSASAAVGRDLQSRGQVKRGGEESVGVEEGTIRWPR